MKEISLLPPELKEHEQEKRRTVLVHAVALGVVGAMLLLYAVSFGAAFISRLEYRSLQAKRISCEREIAALKPYADLDARYRNAAELLNEVRGTFRPWGAFLAGIGLRVPEGVWLTELTLSKPGAQPSAQPAGASGGSGAGAGQSEGTAPASASSSRLSYTCSIKGWAFGHFQLARFLDELQEVQQLSRIQCRTTSTGEYMESSAIQFEITADLWSDRKGSAEGGAR